MSCIILQKALTGWNLLILKRATYVISKMFFTHS